MPDPTQQSELTVVLPAFNEVEGLERVLNALNAQRADFIREIVVVDDGSTDETRAPQKVLSNVDCAF